jgi:hypothetical protein
VGLSLTLSALLGGLLIEGARLGAESSAAAADAVLLALLGQLLPLSAGLLVHPLDPAPGGVAVRAGASRKRLVLWSLGGRTLAMTVTFTALAALGLTRARTLTDPLLGADLTATLPVVALGAAATVTWLAALRLWAGALGAWLGVLMSWLLGASGWIVRAALPAGHLFSLLGLSAALPLPAAASVTLLGVAALGMLALALLRVPR